ncbi:hypothetical protein Syun_005958 [Stephania yunnanensis]|uniref:Reticulon-like protein n=1 Tax=Stephania yunnanensis TaxID=152371 RepID=A0AAP0KXF2_9MAGN
MAIDEDFVEEERPICAVLGGRSFVGRSLVAALLKSRKWTVRIADSAPSVDLDLTESDSVVSEAVSSGFASYFQVDVRLKSQIVGVRFSTIIVKLVDRDDDQASEYSYYANWRKVGFIRSVFNPDVTPSSAAIEGSSVVFHIDATDSSLNDFYHQHSIIVQGTKNVINACRACKVKRLIYNSSADVVFDGTHDIYKGNESLPYPWKFKDMLNDLKSQAEALVLFANSFDGLLTCALRPSNPFGPGDTDLVPSLLNLAKSSFSKFIIGSGEKVSDFTYVDNVAHAHVCAEEALCSGTALWLESPTVKFPASLILFFLVLVNWMFEKLGCERRADSIVNPTVFHLISRTRSFSCLRAQKYIGYRPIASHELPTYSCGEMRREHLCVFWLQQCCFTGSSSQEELLYPPLPTFCCLFQCSSSAMDLCHLHCRLCFKNEKISSDHFQVSQTALMNGFLFLSSIWNQRVQTLRSFPRDGDFSIFFKALVFIYLFKVSSSFSVSAVIAVGLVFAYTAFFVYEQYEHEVDRTTSSLLVGLKNLIVLLMRKLPESATSFLNIHLVSILHEESTMVKDQDNVATM